MRVLLIDVNCKSSSTGQIVYNLYSYLNSHGEEAAICYGRGQEVKEKNIFKFGIDWETNVHALLTRITGYTGCFSYFSTKRLLQFIDDFQPDVVHIHELHAYFVNIKQLLDYLGEKNIKVVHTLHCEFSYTGKCGHSVECEKWKTMCGGCPHLRDYPSTLWFDHTMYMQKVKREAFAKIKYLTIVTPSKWLADRAKQSFFADREIVVIHNGIDTDIFRPVDSSTLRKELGIKTNEKVVLALAPNLMSKEKGGKYVLQIAKILKSERIRFVMVGVEKQIETADSNLIIKGKIYDKQLLAQYYSLADIFVVCSERENFPTTCLEAQCCGTPIYGFDTGGVRETCIMRDNLVNYGDISRLAGLINNAGFKNNKEIQLLTEKAMQLYSKDRFISKQTDLYKL